MLKPKKTLFIAHWYPSQDRPKTGVFVENHAKAIASFTELTVLSIEIIAGPKFYDFSQTLGFENGVTTVRIVIKSKFWKYLYYWIGLQKRLVKKTLRSHGISISEFDLIHSNVLFPSGLLAYRLSKEFGKRLIHSEHWSRLRHFLSSDFHRKEGLKTLRHASLLTCVSPLLKDELKNHVAPEKIRVVPNVIQDQYFLAQEKSLTMPLQFTCTATWEKPKNPFYFLDALQLLQEEKNIPEFEVNMIGEGSQLAEIKQKNYSFKINFLGYLDSQEIIQVLKNTKLFLHGSDYETFSIVIVEALASGTPVLVSDVGIARTLIQASNGFICDHDLPDWKLKIQKALETNYDYAAISSSVGDNYRQKAVAQAFEKCYQEI